MPRRSASARPTAGIDSNEIPIVDIGPVLARDPGAVELAAAAFHEACTGIGFLFLINHRIDRGVVRRAFDAARRFHALPMDEKLKVRMNRHQCGYMPPNVSVHKDTFETHAMAQKAQVSEAYKFTFDLSPDDPDFGKNRRFRGHNKWPEEATAPGVRRAFMEFHETFESFARKLLPVLSVALGMAPEFFTPFFERSSSMTRIAHYPQVPDRNEEISLPGHKDLSFLSLIPPATHPGLEILTPSDEWIAQPVVPEGLLFNTGSTLSRWSNDVYQATPHRVRAASDTDRHSNIFFLYPNVDAVMECLPSCTDSEHPAKYPPVTFGEFHADYAARNFAYAEDWD
ncbi:MAG: 2-oxoglutarate and iron-dependent oxygenase domain-containing protein [Alphaproteobacteria bacterium]